jgi:diguanylate cyclase (GGDEF)-like protein/PAS domain S-box-containing protein
VAISDSGRRDDGRAQAPGGNGRTSQGALEGRATRAINRTVGLLVGLFAIVAAGSILVLSFGLGILSTFRAYANAESLWAKSQKDALLALTRYLDTRDPQDDQAFLDAIKVAEADRHARLEMERPDPDPDTVEKYLLAGRNHPEEVAGMASVFERFRNLDAFGRAVGIWRQGDALLEELVRLHARIRTDAEAGPVDAAKQLAYHREIERINRDVSDATERFAATVGQTTRLLRGLLVKTIAGVTLLMTALAILVSFRVGRLLKRHEETLAASERRYRLLFERNLAGLYRSTLDGRILECNSALARILGYPSREDLLELNMHELHIDPEDREVTLAALLQQRFLVNYEICLRRRDGSPVWVLVNESLLEDDAGPAVLEGSLIDITERKKAEEQSHHQAYHDALTDLPNRILFHDRLSLAILHAHRRRQSLAVMFIDLDHFKNVNDTLGHTAGDEVLIAVAERLRSCLREEDTVARVGGDEFLVLLTGINRDSDVGAMARKLLKSLAEPFPLKKRELFLSASIGVGLYPNDGTDAETLVANVDTAMYRAKEAGRNNFQFFTPHMQEASQERAHLESGLRRALPSQEFTLHYQPILQMSSHRILGVEALVRWNHPERGLLGPKEFIGLAEDVGLIVTIGEWILRTACQEAMRLQAGAFPGLRVAVNLSPRQFQDKDLVWTVQRVLHETGLPPACLELEITESIAMLNLGLTGEVLGELARMGIHIAMDDFGTGHSSLNYLKHFPIHRLKIDRSFVSGMTRDDRDRSIVAAIISMAHNLSLQVTAEGVEAAAQAELLTTMGCDDVQGFLFAPPLPATLLMERLLAVEGAARA